MLVVKSVLVVRVQCLHFPILGTKIDATRSNGAIRGAAVAAVA